MTIEEVETRIGDISLRALRKGGESLQFPVEQALGVAIRHCARVQSGQLTLVPGVVAEIEASFARAEALLV